MSLDNYVKAYEKLSPETIQTELLPCFAKGAYFQDPFNQVTGRKAIAEIFEDMYAQLINPRFEVMHWAQSEGVGYIHWRFLGQTRKGKIEIDFDGVSQVTLNDEGLVTRHVDYWDPSEPVYRKVPVLKWLVQRVRSALKVS